MALNILVVDDSETMRMSVIRTMKMCGLPLGDILEASNGQDGLKILQEHWIDLALVDINMPIMSGEQFIDRVREQPMTKDLQVVIISTESSQKRTESLKKKCAGFIHKPFTPEGLRETVLKVLGVKP